jgi:hypothetical protein
MEKPMSSALPPKLLAHTKLPEESSFETKTSLLPTEVRLVVPAPGSKSIVLQKYPVV